MATATVELDELTCMASEKRAYGPAKVDVKALALARKAAALQDKTLADYLSDLVLEHAPNDIQAWAARLAPKPPKRGEPKP
jgi:hypothetical protein